MKRIKCFEHHLTRCNTALIKTYINIMFKCLELVAYPIKLVIIIKIFESDSIFIINIRLYNLVNDQFALLGVQIYVYLYILYYYLLNTSSY